MNAGLSALSREELYEKMWSLPAPQIATELGVTEVALARRCNQLRVPKPHAAYWAKIAAGQKPARKPLPPTAQETFIREASKPAQKSLRLPDDSEQLHPLALGLLQAIKGFELYSERVHLEQPEYPKVIVTKALAERAAQSFHAILNDVEKVGITFHKAPGKYGPGFFKFGSDRLYLELEEILGPPAVPITPETRSTWPYQSHSDIPRGVLSFAINPSRWGMQDVKLWTESPRSPLGQLLSQIASAIRMNFVETQKQRALDAIEAKKRAIEWEKQRLEYQRKEAIRMAEERKQRHAECLRNISQTRANNLIKAAEWWRLYQTVEQYISECETRWRTLQHGALATDQENWLVWAQNNAKPLSPFEAGYPDPAIDGSFDAPAVSEGGPYPTCRNLPPPPTLANAKPSKPDTHS